MNDRTGFDSLRARGVANMRVAKVAAAIVFLGVALASTAGCGGKVVFEESSSSSSGTAGAGGATIADDCAVACASTTCAAQLGGAQCTAACEAVASQAGACGADLAALLACGASKPQCDVTKCTGEVFALALCCEGHPNDCGGTATGGGPTGGGPGG